MATTISGSQFLTYLNKGRVPAVSLWLGPETYWRDQCRSALIAAKLPPDARQDGYARLDLAELTLPQVLDDAQALSLFASERVLYVAGAEAALPRILKDDSADPQLAAYCKNPAPGVTVVFDCSRYSFDSDDKSKIDRLRKFYAAVPAVIEFDRPDLTQSRMMAENLIAKSGLHLADGALELILEATAGEPARLAQEIEKLALAAGEGAHVPLSLVTDLLPNARATNIFALVSAIGRRDTTAALGLLDTLVRDGEYLPLALSFLATQFRYALAAHQAQLRGSSQIEQYFRRQGVPIWRGRADQVAETVAAFPPEKLRSAILRTFEADRGLRDARPDDRLVLERYLLELRRA
jgi:DNA polymerase-3 subunit delta